MQSLFNRKEIEKLFNAKFLTETTISELFYDSKFVYKIKKPVNLGFINFTNKKERISVTKAEYEINKKISPEIYISLLPIGRYKNNLTLSKKSEILEYAVKMKKLPIKGLLALLLGKGNISNVSTLKIADSAARMHLNIFSMDKIVKYGNPEFIEKNQKQAFNLLKNDAVGVSLKKIELDEMRTAWNFYFKKLLPVFRERVKENKIQRIHGDFHSENIFIEKGNPRITDAILPIKEWEFGDVAVDIGALSMDFDAYGQKDLSKALISRYIKKTGDKSLLGVIHFYKIYWALIRLWVNSASMKSGNREAAKKATMYKKLLFNYFSSITE